MSNPDTGGGAIVPDRRGKGTVATSCQLVVELEPRGCSRMGGGPGEPEPEAPSEGDGVPRATLSPSLGASGSGSFDRPRGPGNERGPARSSRPSRVRSKKSCGKLLRRRPVIEVVNPTGQRNPNSPLG